MSGGSSGGTQAGGSAAPFAGGVSEAQSAFSPTFPFPNTGQAASSALGGISGLNTNPAANYGTAGYVGQQLQSYGNNLANSGQDLGTQALGAWQAGQDPQNALFAKQFQQQQDQSNAVNAMSGVASTPYGAALTTQGNQNFDLNWQNQQLQRENTAANTASTLLGAGGNAIGQGASAATSGLNIGQSIDTQQYNAQQQQIQDFLQYIGASGTNASQYLSALQGLLGGAVNQASVTNTGAQESNAANAASLGGLGSLLGGAGKLALAL